MEVKQGADIIPLPLKNGGTSAAILGLVKRQVDDKTAFLFCGLKENVADALFEEMSEVAEQSALEHHFNIMRAIKVDESRYLDKFDELINQLWLNFYDKMDDSHIAMPSGPVAEQVRALSFRVSNHYKVLLQETQQRFQTLLCREISEHPLTPEVYYRAFWQSLAELDLTYRERSYVMPLFHRFVMDRYGQVLAVANNTLVNLRVDTSRVPPVR